MMIQRLFYAALIALCAWTGYTLLQDHWSKKNVSGINLEQPVFSGSQVDNVSFNNKGLRSYQIKAQTLKHFADNGNTDFTKPVLWVYQNGKQAMWRITADAATLSRDHVLTLNGQVVAYSLAPNSMFKDIHTENLTLNLVNKDFSSPDEVVISGVNFTNQGKGIQGNMDKGEATLLNQVKGQYEPIQN